MNKPILSKQAFWDVDMATIDYAKNARYVIEKVLKNGSYQDFINLRKFYGDRRLQRELVNSKNLNIQEANFCCAIFKLNMQDFKYKIKSYSYPLWDFSGA